MLVADVFFTQPGVISAHLVDHRDPRVVPQSGHNLLTSNQKAVGSSPAGRAGEHSGDLRAGTVIRELYGLRVDPSEQRSLLRPDGAYEAWPRYPRTVAPVEVQEIAVDLERRLDRWIEETRTAGRAG